MADDDQTTKGRVKMDTHETDNDQETSGRAQMDAREKTDGDEQTDGDQLTEHRQKTDVHTMESKAPDDQKTVWGR